MLARSDKAPTPLYDAQTQGLDASALAERSRSAAARLIERVRRSQSRYAEQIGDAARGLQSLPVLSGAELAAEVGAHPPFGRLCLDDAPLIRTGLTAAAVAQPMPIAWSRADLDHEARLGARALWRAGLRPRTRSSDCLDGGLVTPGTLAISDALDALDALALPVGPLTTAAALERAAEVWEIVAPSALIVDAPSLAFLRSQPQHLLDRTAIVLLSPEHGAALAAPAAEGILRVFSLPQVCTFLAGECSARSGLHVAEDAVAVEIVDPRTTAAVADGGRGRLIVSTLERSLAVLRFDTGLAASVDRSPCPCGDGHARLCFG